ncbi:hypothetical protein JCM5353_002535, partial [Sporobolomyces roseus]
VSKYAKTDPLSTVMKPTVRFLLEEHSAIFVHWLVYIRPFTSLLYQLLYAPTGDAATPQAIAIHRERTMRFDRDLFVWDHDTVEPIGYCKDFKKTFKGYDLEGTNVSTWRQYAMAVAEKFLSPYLYQLDAIEGEDPRGNYPDHFLRQSGHNADTARDQYAVTPMGAQGVDRFVVAGTLLATCRDFHPILLPRLLQDPRWLRYWKRRPTLEEQQQAEQQRVFNNKIDQLLQLARRGDTIFSWIQDKLNLVGNLLSGNRGGGGGGPRAIDNGASGGGGAASPINPANRFQELEEDPAGFAPTNQQRDFTRNLVHEAVQATREDSRIQIEALQQNVQQLAKELENQREHPSKRIRTASPQRNSPI